MRRSIRTVLGLAAATAAIAAGVPAFATAANASTTTTSSVARHATSDYARAWGSYWSSNTLARANGFISVRSNRTHVTGKLYDLDHRSYLRGGKCGYVEFRVQPFFGRAYTKSYTYCGDRGYKSIDFWAGNVRSVQARVSQVGMYSHVATSAGLWRDLYRDNHGYRHGWDGHDDHGHDGHGWDDHGHHS